MLVFLRPSFLGTSQPGIGAYAVRLVELVDPLELVNYFPQLRQNSAYTSIDEDDDVRSSKFFYQKDMAMQLRLQKVSKAKMRVSPVV